MARHAHIAIPLALFLVLGLDAQLWAQGAADNSANELVAEFRRITGDWWEPLGQVGLKIFLGMVTIEIATLGFRLAFQKGDLQDLLAPFIMTIVASLFIFALILHYREFCGWVTDGLMGFSQAMPTGHPTVDAGHPLAYASRYTALLFKGLKECTLSLISFNLPLFISALIFACCVVVLFIVSLAISGIFILVQCEFHVLAPLGVIFVGLGALKLFRDYTTNVMRYVLSVGLKLLVIQVLMNVCFAFLDSQLAAFGTMFDSAMDPGSMPTGPWGLPTESLGAFRNRAFEGLVPQCLLMVGYSVIMLCLVAKIPESCAGLVSGASMGGSNPVLGMARTGMGMAVGAATGVGVAGVGLALATKAGFSLAREQGLGTGQALWGGLKSGAAATFLGGTRTGSRIQAIRQAAMPPDKDPVGTGQPAPQPDSNKEG